MGGIAPANQLRLSFTGSEDGEAETETCRAAKPLWRTTLRTSGPRGLNSLNRRMRTRMYGCVGGEDGRSSPLFPFRKKSRPENWLFADDGDGGAGNLETHQAMIAIEQ